MPRGRFNRAGRAALALVVGPVLALAHLWGFFAIWAALLLALYGYSLWRYPFTPCWLCGGPGTRGERTGIWPWAFGLCPVCRGAKQRLRLGVRVLAPARARRLAEQYSTAEAMRQRRTRRLVP